MSCIVIYSKSIPIDSGGTDYFTDYFIVSVDISGNIGHIEYGSTDKDDAAQQCYDNIWIYLNSDGNIVKVILDAYKKWAKCL